MVWAQVHAFRPDGLGQRSHSDPPDCPCGRRITSSICGLEMSAGTCAAKLRARCTVSHAAPVWVRLKYWYFILMGMALGGVGMWVSVMPGRALLMSWSMCVAEQTFTSCGTRRIMLSSLASAATARYMRVLARYLSWSTAVA